MKEMTQFVTLGIDRETFALPVETVREILDMCEISRLPNAPAQLLGMIDVRGTCVPVIDLRTKFGLPRIEATASTRILVLELQQEGQTTLIGLVADRVFEVTGLDGDRHHLNALRFWQKRGFKLLKVYPDAVANTRKLKPTIPIIGENGIPLRDEIELELQLA